MPKRVYPFGENLLPQLKIHIGQKQIDKGVSSDERMKDVYNKTLNLLRTGIKIFSYRSNEMVQMDPMNLSLAQPTKSKSLSNPKQMLLTKELQLTATDKIINDTQIDLCGCCRVIDQSIINKCSYCDQVFCPSCLSLCAGCTELFCQDCSLPIYNREEQNMCLNCYR